LEVAARLRDLSHRFHNACYQHSSREPFRRVRRR
jgi:hypothetical protein